MKSQFKKVVGLMLIGANGAGKSTLMKVISGVNSNYSGEIFFNGEKIEIRSPREAFKYGVQTVYQEVDTALVPSLTVAENLYMNKLVNQMEKVQFINWSEVYSLSKKQLEELKIDIDVRKKVEDLTLAEKQMVLIAKAVMEDCKFLLLDEPTAPLSNTETEKLFDIVNKLVKENNVGVVFISHRLHELFEICDEITIMREGRVVHHQAVDEDLTIRKIVDYMLGDKKVIAFNRESCGTDKTVLKVKNLSEAEGKIKNISFDLREGEVLGVAGLVGGGKTELCKALFGAYDVDCEELQIDGKDIRIKNQLKP